MLLMYHTTTQYYTIPFNLYARFSEKNAENRIHAQKKTNLTHSNGKAIETIAVAVW